MENALKNALNCEAQLFVQHVLRMCYTVQRHGLTFKHSGVHPEQH